MGCRELVLIPCRSSTLENWVREFQKFSPQIDVRTYYGSQNERFDLRDEYREMADNNELEVLLTTYDMAWKPDDNKFLRRKIQFDVSRGRPENRPRLIASSSAASLTKVIRSRISKVNGTRA